MCDLQYQERTLTVSRAAQDILWTLLEWAKQGHERTLNQRVRPALIIILNRISPGEEDDLGSMDTATRQLLGSFQRSDRFKQFRETWRTRGRGIRTASDLIRCYYDDFKVIPIPQHNNGPSTAKKVCERIKQLYREIHSLSENIYHKRKEANMCMDISTFNSYIRKSTKILARDLKSSIDFYPLAKGDNSLPTRLSEHLALMLRSVAEERRAGFAPASQAEQRMVKDAIPYLAWCVMARVMRRQAHEGK